jgi:hypothetical protein
LWARPSFRPIAFPWLKEYPSAAEREAIMAGISRRGFLKTTAVAAASHSMAPGSPAAQISANQGPARIEVRDDTLFVETKSLRAVFKKAFLTSLQSKASAREYIEAFDVQTRAALTLLYVPREEVRIDESKFGKILLRQVSAEKAEFIIQSWEGDGVVAVSVDPATGDLVVAPSAYSSRPGVRACRWSLRGIDPRLKLVAPFFQGVRLPLPDDLLKDTHWPWPQSWEAGLAILEAAEGGFWIRCEDTAYRYKALHVGSQDETQTIGLDTESYGPAEQNLAAGGLAWRINCFEGEWKNPAAAYRDWLWRSYSLEAREKARQSWTRDVRLALSWCPTQPDLLTALAKVIDPRLVLLHVPNWRSDPYDENYPNYVASQAGKDFVKAAQAAGFRVMPHFNSVDMDPNHPVYNSIRDFQYRDLENKRIQGWSWYHRRVIGVPESNTNRTGHRDKKVMVKVHPGLSMWRSILGDNILKASQDLSLETVFIDVTLVSSNLYNALVENSTSTEGMKRLIDHVGSLGSGLVVGGEGRNEITMQGLSFAQEHLFKSWQENIRGVERTGGCPLNDLLFGRLCRTFGYSGLGGEDADEELRMQLHQEHGAIPTLTVRSAREILEPNAAVKKTLERARSGI